MTAPSGTGPLACAPVPRSVHKRHRKAFAVVSRTYPASRRRALLEPVIAPFPTSKTCGASQPLDRRESAIIRGPQDAPTIGPWLLEKAKNARALSHAKRAERLLQYIAARESSSPGHPVTLGHPTIPEALAHSESWNDGQINTLLELLGGQAMAYRSEVIGRSPVYRDVLAARG